MTAKLIGITKSTIDKIHTPCEFIAYCARVSNPSNQINNLTASKLLKYLAEHKHWSPFEMVNIVIEVTTTRDIARQILRHRSFSFQETSQRYSDSSDMIGNPREARLQDTKNRQNSIETTDLNLQKAWDLFQKRVSEKALETYNWAIENGIAKEQARVVLPEGLTNSKMYINGTLRSWLHYCSLRMGKETQKEHREVATNCWYIILKEFPELQDISIGS